MAGPARASPGLPGVCRRFSRVHGLPSGSTLVAAGREIARGNRVKGMAVSQAEVVHQGVLYDLEVDTTHSESLECARTIAAQIR